MINTQTSVNVHLTIAYYKIVHVVEKKKLRKSKIILSSKKITVF